MQGGISEPCWSRRLTIPTTPFRSYPLERWSFLIHPLVEKGDEGEDTSQTYLVLDVSSVVIFVKRGSWFE